jgi:hypothetical protein
MREVYVLFPGGVECVPTAARLRNAIIAQIMLIRGFKEEVALTSASSKYNKDNWLSLFLLNLQVS